MPPSSLLLLLTLFPSFLSCFCLSDKPSRAAPVTICPLLSSMQPYDHAREVRRLDEEQETSRNVKKTEPSRHAEMTRIKRRDEAGERGCPLCGARSDGQGAEKWHREWQRRAATPPPCLSLSMNQPRPRTGRGGRRGSLDGRETDLDPVVAVPVDKRTAREASGSLCFPVSQNSASISFWGYFPHPPPPSRPTRRPAASSAPSPPFRLKTSGMRVHAMQGGEGGWSKPVNFDIILVIVDDVAPLAPGLLGLLARGRVVLPRRGAKRRDTGRAAP
jgi:hypothetical protein